MKSSKLAILLFVLFGSSSYSQSDSLQRSNEVRASIYAEIMGNGGLLSFNMEMGYMFEQSREGVYLRLGVGDDYSGIPFLVELGYLNGNGRRFFELGGGYSRGIDADYYILRLGYRYHSKSGFLFRIAPLLVRKEEYQELSEQTETQIAGTIGVSIGYSLSSGKR